MEKLGKPAVMVDVKMFVADSMNSAGAVGMPDLRIIGLPVAQTMDMSAPDLEKLAREETVQDVLELKRLKDLEPQAVSFEEYLKDRNV